MAKIPRLKAAEPDEWVELAIASYHAWRATNCVGDMLCPTCFNDLRMVDRDARMTPEGPEPPHALISCKTCDRALIYKTGPIDPRMLQ